MFPCNTIPAQRHKDAKIILRFPQFLTSQQGLTKKINDLT